ncbi:hypothetical protein DCCM_4571 [Desulfocucumis palustris]|uniref:Uncharacterized protein n=1 Tax=Desulfocucumis palustris TaxID=1898651 RepID=A0A2L2XHH4_9FIRM|nr:hypothetical protein DCCM_4571 [Desulfocucumis palustris]
MFAKLRNHSKKSIGQDVLFTFLILANHTTPLKNYSFVTPLNGFPPDFTSINRPVLLSRLTHVPDFGL